MRSWYSVFLFCKPRHWMTCIVSSDTSIVSTRLPSMRADRIRLFSLRWYSLVNTQWCRACPSSIYSCTLSSTRIWMVPSEKAIPKNGALSFWNCTSSSCASCRLCSSCSHSCRARNFRRISLWACCKSSGQTKWALCVSRPSLISISI